MKVRCKNDFQDAVQEDRAWRVKEMSNLKAMVYASREAYLHTHVRSGILLLYAHWEGHVKRVCEAFFMYMNFKSYNYTKLKENFLAFGILNQFDSDFPAKRFDSYLIAVNFITTGCSNQKFKVDVPKYVTTKNNLNIDVLNELMAKMGVDDNIFSNHQYYIDSRLLKLRNAIAHGDRTDNNDDLYLSKDDFFELFQKIDELMHHFGKLVIDYVENEAYMSLGAEA